MAIDPAAQNTRALCAYRAAGFTGEADIIDKDGIAVIPMIFTKGNPK